VTPPPRSLAERLLPAGFLLTIALYVAVIVIKPGVFFADDSYFYFQVAWNFAHGLGSTFNGVMNTNGYHPLWMLVCALVCKLSLSKAAAVHGIAAAICLCDLLMLWLVQRILARVADNLWPIAFVLLVPFSFLSQLGTEGALSGCLLAASVLAVYDFVRGPTAVRALLFNLIAALAVLARLDNIFIIGFLWLAVWLAAPVTLRASIFKLQVFCIPVYLVLWGGYLASNFYYFGIFQPISGMVKSHPTLHLRLGSNLPHTAWHMLAIILPCMALLGWKRRDLFFRLVELPFALGVLCHACYIVFRMSDETRWSWYYTSWVLLASLLLARVTSLLLPHLARFLGRSRSALALSMAWACLLVLLAGWVKISFLHFYRGPDSGQPFFLQQVAQSKGLHTAFSFDKPGQIAYYTTIRVIPLDDLMGNMDFQRQLIARGIDRYAADHGVDTFIGPPVPLNGDGYKDFCQAIYLDSMFFHCIQTGPATWMPVSVDVYARVPHSYVGSLQLHPAQLLWTQPGQVSFWRILPDASADAPRPSF
jgi:hypothetical protein